MSRFVIAPMIFLVALFSQCGLAQTDQLSLSGDRFWVVLASRPDPDQAAAAAQEFLSLKPIVVRSANGWFAAVAGPFGIPSGSGRQFLDAMIKDRHAPKDAYLTKGASFIETVWTSPATNVMDTSQYDGEHNVTFRANDLEIKLTRRKLSDEDSAAVAIGTFKGKQAFQMEFTENPSEKPASQVQLIRLDPNSPMPQVVFTYFWQGAHCCTMTKIANLDKEGDWHVIDGDTLDGDGYSFEDIFGKGYSYLVSNDNAFLYAFDSYAGSYPPIKIHQLVGDQLIDVTKVPQFQHRLLQSLFLQEQSAKESDDNWHSNGFLAGWVASSLLAGRGDAAWTKMLASYDHQSDFATEKCTTNLPIEKCPDDRKIKLAFPFALRQFLQDHGYINDASRFNVPFEVEPSSPTQQNPPSTNVAPQSYRLQQCANVSDLVRKLIYQTFAGRNIHSGESYDSVSLQNDTTLEEFDPTTEKVTCAVTYEITLRPLVGRLAEEGNFRRAEFVNATFSPFVRFGFY